LRFPPGPGTSIWTYWLRQRKGDTAIVQTLLDEGADVNAGTKDGETALMFAEFKGYNEIIALLKSAGATEPE
jgi:ankyrin repeat protein